MATIMPVISNSNFVGTKVHNGFYKEVTEMVDDYRKYSMDIQSSKKYEIIPITKDDTENVINFLRKFFFRDEPLNVAVGLLDEGDTCSELEEYCISCIPDGLSIAACSSSGNIIGICLNALVTKEQTETENTTEDIKHCQNPKFKKILQLLSFLKKQSNVFGLYPDIDKVLDIVILSVDESYRGQGICKALIQKTREIAAEHNIPLIRVDCSSHFSSKAVARLGFKRIYSISYDDYVDDEGNKVFNTQAPHSSAVTYVSPIFV